MNTLTLKWGTIKSCKFDSPYANKLLKQYDFIEDNKNIDEITEEQRDIICKLIDLVDDNYIYTSWDGELSKDAAKDYVKNYNK